jgi:O-antigen/teichoic acid export membrane protein
LASIKKSFEKIISNDRTKKVFANLSVSFIANAVSLIFTFLLVPISLKYVGTESYGVWLTIASIIAWFSFFDIGLGNGLRNKLAVAIANNEVDTARTYISSAYFLIAFISVIMFFCFFVIARVVSWNSILNTDFISNDELYSIVSLVIFFFCISFSLKTLYSILEALQMYAIKDIISVSTQVLGFIAILILVNTTEGSLYNLSLVYSAQSAVGLLLGSLVLFSGRLSHLRPSTQFISIKESLPLVNLGVWFFVNQIMYMITTQISIFLVAHFFGPGDVTEFNLAKNYMAISSMLFVIVLTPFLSAFTEAYTKRDFDWIKSSMRTILYSFAIASFATLLLVVWYRIFFSIWVDSKVMPALSLIIVLGVSGIFQMFSAIFTLVLNGIGKIRLQFFTLLLSAILFIPMVYFFQSWGWGLSSLVIPSIVFGVFNSVIYYKQYNLILSQRASGVWNQ